MNILNQILKGIADLIGADPSTLTTEDKTLVGALNELDAATDDINSRMVDYVPSDETKPGTSGLVPAPVQISHWVKNLSHEIVLTLNGWQGLMYSFRQDNNTGALQFWNEYFSLDSDGRGRHGFGTGVPVATPSLNGVMSKDDKAKLDSIDVFTPSSTSEAGKAGLLPAPAKLGASAKEYLCFPTLKGWRQFRTDCIFKSDQVNLTYWALPLGGADGTTEWVDVHILSATNARAGVMTSADKIKLDALPNIHFSTEEPKASDGEDGDMWLVYKPSTEG